MRHAFFWVASALAGFCLLLALGWALAPSLLSAAWELQLGTPADVVLTHRTAALYLGLGLLLFLCRRTPPSPARRGVAVGAAVTCAGLAVAGLRSFAVGVTGPGGLATAIFELAVCVALLMADRADARLSAQPVQSAEVPAPAS